MSRQSEKKSSFHFQFNGQIVVASQASTVLDSLLAAKIEIDHSCGGSGSCGTCRAILLPSSAPASPRSELEAEMAEIRGFEGKERLCCQLEATPNLVLQSPDFDVTKKGLE